MRLFIKLITIGITVFSFSIINANSNIKLQSVDIDINDKLSLQRGAKIFFDKCIGCHSLKYIRYIDLATGIGFKEDKKKSIEILIKQNLINDKNLNINDYVTGYMYNKDAIKWFGKIPPDLSLISRYRTDNWVYTYMKSFYIDKNRSIGINNLVFPDVGMPHVLLQLQGKQILKENKHSNNPDDLLELTENGSLSKTEYNKLIKDLVCFLSYVGEPKKTERINFGIYVLIFTFILTITLYLLKKEYWKDIKNIK
ncbi:MAG: cytochrome c1 [Deltaproteobacteria bacterium]